MIENSFANVMRIFGTGFGLVVVIMVMLAAIMEVTGVVVQKYEQRSKAKSKGKES